MSDKNKKQFGVWMDTQTAIIAGKDENGEGEFAVLGRITNRGADNNSSEHSGNNHEIALTQKFFKEIAGQLQNPEEVHITGTGQIQEQFLKFLAETPQYKNAQTTESTSNKMNDEELIGFFYHSLQLRKKHFLPGHALFPEGVHI